MQHLLVIAEAAGDHTLTSRVAGLTVRHPPRRIDVRNAAVTVDR
jgi:hypothetical protein